jgi:hypothetical protein
MLFAEIALATEERKLGEQLWLPTIDSGRPFLGRAALLIPNLNSPFSPLHRDS